MNNKAVFITGAALGALGYLALSNKSCKNISGGDPHSEKPPIKAINAWILKAHITPKQGITAKQLPWVIQAAIGKKGQTHRRKFPFIEPSIQAVLAKDLDGIFGKAIDTVAQQYYKTK